MNLNRQIKNLRLKKGYTQLDLSEKTGLSLRTIQRIEKNEVKPSLYSLKKIGDVFQEEFDMKDYSPSESFLKKENRNYLVFFMSLISISIGIFFYTHDDRNNKVKIVDMKVQSDDLADFVLFDWSSLNEVVELNTDNEFIIHLEYNNRNKKSSDRLENFSLKFELSKDNFQERVKNIKDKLENLNALDIQLREKS
jgi:transcriptional regulator with XRE-family HTH domain